MILSVIPDGFANELTYFTVRYRIIFSVTHLVHLLVNATYNFTLKFTVITFRFTVPVLQIQSSRILIDRLCGLVVRVSGYRYRGLGFDSRRYQIF